MRIVVFLKAIPAMVSGAWVAEGGGGVDYPSRSFVMNEPDEYALEEALALRGKLGGQVTATSLGLPQSEEVLWVALAKGADRAVRVEGKYSDADRTSLLLAGAAGRLGFDLIMAGTESWDNMASQVAVAVAARLGIPFVFGATSVALLDARAAVVTKELGGGSNQILEVSLPALLCLQTGTRRLSNAPYAKLVQARRRPMECLALDDLQIDRQSLATGGNCRILAVSTPVRAHAAEILSGLAGEIANRAADIIERAW